MSNCIIVTGNIGCGKTTLSKVYVEQGYIVVSRDRLRYGIGNGKYIYNTRYEPVIFKVEKYLFQEFLKLGVNIFVDEIGITKNLRQKYLDMLKKYPEYQAYCIELPRLSKEEAVNRRMNDPHGQCDRALWESVWEKFDKMYERPEIEEGFVSIDRM